MQNKSDMIIYQENRLVVRWINKKGKRCSQGKRVGKDCPLTFEERREYVLRGSGYAIKLLKANRKCSFVEALELLHAARGYANEAGRCGVA